MLLLIVSLNCVSVVVAVVLIVTEELELAGYQKDNIIQQHVEWFKKLGITVTYANSIVKLIWGDDKKLWDEDSIPMVNKETIYKNSIQGNIKEKDKNTSNENDLWIFKGKLTQKLVNKKGEFLNIYAALVGIIESGYSKYWREKPPMDRGENKEWFEKRKSLQKETLNKIKNKIIQFDGEEGKDGMLEMQRKAYKFFFQSMKAIRYECGDKLIPEDELLILLNDKLSGAADKYFNLLQLDNRMPNTLTEFYKEIVDKFLRCINYQKIKTQVILSMQAKKDDIVMLGKDAFKEIEAEVELYNIVVEVSTGAQKNIQAYITNVDLYHRCLGILKDTKLYQKVFEDKDKLVYNYNELMDRIEEYKKSYARISVLEMQSGMYTNKSVGSNIATTAGNLNSINAFNRNSNMDDKYKKYKIKCKICKKQHNYVDCPSYDPRRDPASELYDKKAAARRFEQKMSYIKKRFSEFNGNKGNNNGAVNNNEISSDNDKYKKSNSQSNENELYNFRYNDRSRRSRFRNNGRNDRYQSRSRSHSNGKYRNNRYYGRSRSQGRNKNYYRSNSRNRYNNRYRRNSSRERYSRSNSRRRDDRSSSRNRYRNNKQYYNMESNHQSNNNSSDKYEGNTNNEKDEECDDFNDHTRYAVSSIDDCDDMMTVKNMNLMVSTRNCDESSDDGVEWYDYESRFDSDNIEITYDDIDEEQTSDVQVRRFFGNPKNIELIEGLRKANKLINENIRFTNLCIAFVSCITTMLIFRVGILTMLYVIIYSIVTINNSNLMKRNTLITLYSSKIMLFCLAERYNNGNRVATKDGNIRKGSETKKALNMLNKQNDKNETKKTDDIIDELTRKDNMILEQNDGARLFFKNFNISYRPKIISFF